jgi:cyclic di-GMP phosphodiesterase
MGDGHHSRILIVDDEEMNRVLLGRLLAEAGFHADTADRGETALEMIAAHAPDLVLLDLSMPGINGLEVAARLKQDPSTSQIPIIMITALSDRQSRMDALNRGIEEFISKPFDPTELLVRVRNLLRLKEFSDRLSHYSADLEEQVRDRTAQLASSYRESIFLMVKAAEYRDDDTGDHVRRIGRYTSRLAELMGHPSTFVDCIAHASMMHDIGKIGIPDAVLLKPAALTAEELGVMKSHTVLGKEILEAGSTPYLRMGAIVALTHHENWDGTGYPRGLSGADIPVESRIMKICDQYDALRSKRPYKQALEHEAALDIILRGDGRTRVSHFAPDVLEAFRESAAEFRDIYDRFDTWP